MPYTRELTSLSILDKLYMVKKRLLKLAARLVPGLKLRLWLWRRAGVQLGSHVYIGEELLITEILENREPQVFIGDRVAIAQRVTLVTASDPNCCLLYTSPSPRDS